MNERQLSTSEAMRQRLANLSPEKLDALQKKLKRQEQAKYEPIGALGDEDVYPLSFHQRRLWFIEQLQKGIPLYNVPRAIRMRGPLNREALRSALQLLVERHEALRTTFHTIDGEPVQRINPPGRLEIPLVDLRTANDPTASLQQHLIDDGHRIFDLAKDLMLRAVLFQMGDDDHALQITLHHLVSDGWSLRLLFGELGALYRAMCLNETAELPPVQLRYVDFASWQRQPPQMQRFGEQMQWWKQRLAGVPTVLELPADHPRPAAQSGAGATMPMSVPSDLIKRLETWGRSENATLFMSLLTAYFILLHRYTGMKDMVVGSAIAGRHRPETHGTVGFFVDTVALRADLSGQPTARQLLRQVQETVIDAIEHSDVPFDRVVNELDVPKDLSRHPLFQVIFNAPPQYPLELHELELSPINVERRLSRFDLELTWAQGANRTTGATWNTDLFDTETIRRMLDHYSALLNSIVDCPDQPVGELPMLTARERDQLVVDFNDTDAPYPSDKCVHELFEQQVAQTPDAVAVVSDDQKLSYRELNERANRLAHHLRSLGVTAETPVGICLPRSHDLIASVLGILKAGGTYVPLDADDPPQRLKFMIEDANVAFLVTQQAQVDRLPGDGCRVVCIDALGDGDTSNPSINTNADSLAYVMFTSGSTGQPKGAAIRHTSIARLVFANDYAAFGPDRVFVQLAHASFDAATFELWGALLHGAKLVVPPPGLPEFEQLEEMLKRHGVTTLWLTATLFNQVIDHRPQALAGVQEILTGGEALSPRHIRRAQAQLGGDVQLINGYGPTENTTFTTCYRIPANIADDVESIPIGRPIANTKVYVVDDLDQPVPIGIAGELLIGGAGLARLYVQRPELTATRFVANPFSNDPRSRLYRTGDLCRWRADGNLEFLGRLDDQVKLRGFRIEPGEIEIALNEHPDIAQSVVMLREDRPGEKRLVAYFVGHDRMPDASELRNHLRDRLPDYMTPSALVGMDSMPLTPSGKVDRRALPAPSWTEPQAGHVEPSNPIEQELARIWCELLDIDRVGVNESFFDLGGHSLMAVNLFARIEESFGCRLPLAVLFQNGTIKRLANQIAVAGDDNEIATITPLCTDANGRRVFVMPSVGGTLLFSRELIEELGKHFQVYGIQPALAPRNLEQFRSFRTTARCFVDTLRRFQPSGPYALTGFSYGGLMAYEVACLLTAMGEQVDVLAVIDTGPGQRGIETPQGDRVRRLRRIVANLPGYLREELRDFSPSRLTGSALRKLRRLYRRIASHGQAELKLDDVFNTGHIPSQNLELMYTVFAALRDYVPRPYPGKLTLLRAKTDSLLSGRAGDLGWSHWVESLDVHNIAGNHESLLRPPHLAELSGKLIELLDQT